MSGVDSYKPNDDEGIILNNNRNINNLDSCSIEVVSGIPVIEPLFNGSVCHNIYSTDIKFGNGESIINIFFYLLFYYLILFLLYNRFRGCWCLTSNSNSSKYIEQ